MKRDSLDLSPLLLFIFSVIRSIITVQSSLPPPCIQTCPGVSSSPNNHLPFPFGFSDGCHIRLNCTNKGEIFIGEFQVDNVTSHTIIVKMNPICNHRSISSLSPLFNTNFALTLRNGLLLQNCPNPPRGCAIPEALLGTQFDFNNCDRPYCFSSNKKKKTGSSFLSYTNVNQSSCKYLYSSLVAMNTSLSNVTLEFNKLELGWWLEGSCNCSSNAQCTKVVSPFNQRSGYRCHCSQGYEGDGFSAGGRGCWKPATPKCDPKKYVSGECSGKTRRSVLIGGVIAGFCLMTGLAFLCYAIRKRSTSRKIRKSAKKLLSDAEGSSSLPFYRYKEIKRATNGFSDKQRLGTGAYGTVYAGKLHNDEWVAIKRIRYRDGDSIEQVVNEIKLLSSVRHPNLVRLLGFCIEKSEQILVYEFMPNGTLSQHLQRERGTGLPWTTRLAIACETAQAISHLHFALNPPIYHRDVKSSNILLDFSFSSKVADFGLSRVGIIELSHISTAPQGTPGYLDPQYHQNFHLSDRSDVYSFGVVLLEIITGLKVVDFSRPPNEVNLSCYALEKITKGCLGEIIDPFLDLTSDVWTYTSLNKVAELAFRCLAFHSETRPSMMEVADELESIRLIISAPQKEQKIDTSPSLNSYSSTPSNEHDKSESVIVNTVDRVEGNLNAVVPQIHSYVIPKEEEKDGCCVTLQEIWSTEGSSSPLTNGLLLNVVH